MSKELVLGHGTQPIEPAILAQYEVEKFVTRSVLQQENGVPIYVQFEGPAYLGQMVENAKYDTPPHLAEIINLLTGEYQVLIMNAVMLSELQRNYPDDGYVGRCFAMSSAKGSETDKRYRVYKIVELKRRASGVHEAVNAIDGTTAEAVDHAKKKR